MIVQGLRRIRSVLLAGAALSLLAGAAAVVILPPVAAHAQAQVSLEFREALEPFGQWVPHRRWGEVWVPSGLPRDWRPYTEGRWVYTDEWGWYWVSDEPFGWIVYHYGRWVFDDSLGWLWLPSEEWGPAWVSWRRGGGYAGWAALPPDEIVEEVYENPNPRVWTFVPAAAVAAPRIRTVMLPPPRVKQFFSRTVVVNRTFVVRERGPEFAVNPGIPPAYIAAASRRPIRAVEIRPQVLAGTRGVSGAVEVRSDEVREYWRERRSRPDVRPGRGPMEDRFRPVVRETQTTIAPARVVPPPQRLEPAGQGRLGDRPPRAAQTVPGGAPAELVHPPGGGRTGTPTVDDNRPRPRPGAITPGGQQPPDQPPRARPGAITPSAQPPGQATPAQPAPPAGPPGAGSAQPPRQPSAPAAPAGPIRRFEDRRPPPPANTPPPPAVQRPAPPSPPSPPAVQRPPAPPPPAVQRPV